MLLNPLQEEWVKNEDSLDLDMMPIDAVYTVHQKIHKHNKSHKLHSVHFSAIATAQISFAIHLQ